MAKRFFVLSLVFCLLCSQVFAFAFVPGKKTDVATPATVETEEVLQPEAEISVPSPVPSLDEVIAQLENSKKIQKSREEAAAVADLKESYEALRAVNRITLDSLETAEKELDRVHLSIGLGGLFFPDVIRDKHDVFGIHGVAGIRKGDWMVQGFAGFYNPCNLDPCRETLYGGVNVCYEF